MGLTFKEIILTLLQYSGFVSVTVIAIVLVMRSCYFLFVIKSDPIKSLLPDIARWFMKNEKEKQMNKSMLGNS